MFSSFNGQRPLKNLRKLAPSIFGQCRVVETCIQRRVFNWVSLHELFDTKNDESQSALSQT